MREYHICCSGCHKPDKETKIGKKEECFMCEGRGTCEEIYNDGWCADCEGTGKREYIPKTTHHHWARVDAYGIYTGVYCDKCYKDNYPYKRGRYHDPAYCGESMDEE